MRETQTDKQSDRKTDRQAGSQLASLPDRQTDRRRRMEEGPQGEVSNAFFDLSPFICISPWVDSRLGINVGVSPSRPSLY